ncbi:uncharacterized protein LOC128254977 [Drosophila gunungcola]|uniref:uncharacterized protein LOC128254977 n=1 Tax=Drosophila gunungcola TaxID=103775 RepID=UPI0022DFA3CC|nr:uncharacterized protein LOC128254977 [Drosophila gunungcola]
MADELNPLSPTSEVGSPPLQDNSENSWRTLLESQNRLLTPTQQHGAKRLSMILCEHPQEGASLVMTLSKSLLGSASQWLSQICFAGMSWAEFKELFMERYEGNETPAALLLNMLKGRPSPNECLSVYSSRMVTSLLTKWKAMTHEEIAISLVLAHSSQIDSRLQRLVFTTNIKTRAELQQQLKAHSFARNSEFSGMDMGPEKKRFKMQTPIRCHSCGKLGHKAIECRRRKAEERNETRAGHSNGRSTMMRERHVTCFKCGNVGHIASVCTMGPAAASKSSERRVDMCAIHQPNGTAIQFGERFPFFFDSGSECSLVKETTGEKLGGKRCHNLVVLRGIGDNIVKSTMQILSTVQISEFNFELLFHVVDNKCLKYDMIIGQDIFQLGFGVMLESNKFDIYRTQTVLSVIDDNTLNKIDYKIMLI